MKFAIIANPEKYSVRDSFTSVMNWFGSNDHEVLITKKLHNQFNDRDPADYVTLFSKEEEIIPEADVLIAIGGDGTILHTAQLARDSGKPILGINTGRLGFMANVQPEDISTALDSVAAMNYSIDERFFLRAKTDTGETLYALNEFLFSRRGTTSLVTLSAFYGGELLNRFWSDGLIISAPTGSTAYNLSAGGPIIMPGTSVMVITPINPHTLTTRPLVLPSEKELQIIVEDNPEQILFSCDGRPTEHTVENATITSSKSSVKLIRLPDQTWFKTLRNKLMWGADNRDLNK